MAAKFFTGLPLDGPDPECVQGFGETALTKLKEGKTELPKASGDHSHRTERYSKSGKVELTLTRREGLGPVLKSTIAAPPVSDCAEELQLALSVGCEGVVIAPAGQPFSAEGRHIVSLTAPAGSGKDGLAAVEPVYVWRTLMNMGLVHGDQDGPRMAQAR